LIFDLLIVLLLLLWEKRRKFQGEILVAGLILYSIARFTVEFFRESYIVFAGLSQAQVACIILLLILIPIFITGRKKSNSPGKS